MNGCLLGVRHGQAEVFGHHLGGVSLVGCVETLLHRLPGHTKRRTDVRPRMAVHPAVLDVGSDTKPGCGGTAQTPGSGRTPRHMCRWSAWRTSRPRSASPLRRSKVVTFGAL